MEEQVGLVSEVSQNGEITARPIFNKPKEMKVAPKIYVSFSNGIPRQYLQSKGFETELTGTYDGCLALLEEMRKAIVMFKEEDGRLGEPKAGVSE